MYNATNDATRGGLGLGKELMDGVWQVFSRYDMVYCIVTVYMVVYVMW